MRRFSLLAGPFFYLLLGASPRADTAAALLDNYAILDREAIETAAPAELSAEASVFESIGIGIALSIAQCESVEFCFLALEQSEIQELIDLLAYRIETLDARQRAGGSDGLDGILGAYVGQRDNYTGYLEKLRRLRVAEAAGRAESIESDLNFFADEELVDDEGLGAAESPES